MATLYVNDRAIEARPGEMLLDVLKRVGIRVPTLCHLDCLPPTGACRMCVVEVEGQRTLLPSCAYPVADGMRIRTHSPRAVRARKTILELLLANHPDECLYCTRNATCELRRLAAELGIRQKRYVGERNNYKTDNSSPAIVRDQDKCILCGKCVRVCEEIQGVSAIDFVGRGSRTRIGTAFEQGLNVSSCVACGQCITVCPTGALRQKGSIKEVLNALIESEIFVIVQHAPSVSVTLAEEFALPPGIDVCGAMTAALRRLGFDRVYDTAFAADLTIMEEASELVYRIQHNGVLPMMTSCSPGWIKFVEQFYPDFIDNLSTCKSPQQMLGAVAKRLIAEREGIDPARVFSVSIMPCTAKKFESSRPEMTHNGLPDVDAVLTTREFAQMIRMYGLDLSTLEAETADSPLGARSTAGKIFGVTGGVMEAAIRTAHYLVSGKDLENLEVAPVRGFEGLKETRVQIGALELGVAVVSGLGNARRLLDELRAGRRRDLHFIEVMTCPGGCIAGGGQPLGSDLNAVRARMRALYTIDGTENVRTAHHNPEVRRLYEEVLDHPLSHKSHELLHTHYTKRQVLL